MELTPTDKSNLLAIFHTQGYATIITILENLCDESEAELLIEDPSNGPKVIAAHNRARAYREFFNRFLKKVDAAVAVEPTVPQLTNREIFMKTLES